MDPAVNTLVLLGWFQNMLVNPIWIVRCVLSRPLASVSASFQPARLLSAPGPASRLLQLILQRVSASALRLQSVSAFSEGLQRVLALASSLQWFPAFATGPQWVPAFAFAASLLLGCLVLSCLCTCA